MKVILKNSTIQFQENPQPGDWVTITPDFVNSDFSGYRIQTNGKLSTSSVNSVSSAVAVAGYDKVKIINPAINQYVAQCAFFDSTSNTQGTNPVVVSSGTGDIGEDVTVDIPQGAVYVRFNTNNNSSGTPIAGRVIQMRVAVEE